LTPPRRILAVKLADLGDLLTITPALQALRAAQRLRV
jgi:ADP-heptose:LPS heptosyltransferase